MLRMYVAQQCFGLSHEGIEDASYDSQSIRAFVGIDLGRESAPDATTLLKFRHLLEAKELTRQIFDAINGHLAAKGLMMREGTIVDATLIAAPPTTKNKDGKRDPEMHQSKKGNDWHFGMKAHIGVDAASGLVHTVVGTAGNVSDVTQAHALLHGDETAALGDAGYQGVETRPENVGKAVTWHVAMKRPKRKALPNNKLGRMAERLEHLKASVRAKVEPPFHVIKNLFRHRKTRYRGLDKNTRSCSHCSPSPTWCWPAGDLPSLKPEERLDRGKAPGKALNRLKTSSFDPRINQYRGRRRSCALTSILG